MANSIALFKKYIDRLDKVYKQSATSSILDGDNTLVSAGTNANEIVIPKISMDGLADYSRNGGYVSGDVKITHETVKFNYDRGRMFDVDAMDNEETAGIAFGQLVSEFIRTKVAPEMDAFRYATYAAISGISKVSAGATLSGRCVGYNCASCGNYQNGRGRGSYGKQNFVHHPYSRRRYSGYGHNQVERGSFEIFKQNPCSADAFLHCD